MMKKISSSASVLELQLIWTAVKPPSLKNLNIDHSHHLDDNWEEQAFDMHVMSSDLAEKGDWICALQSIVAYLK